MQHSNLHLILLVNSEVYAVLRVGRDAAAAQNPLFLNPLKSTAQNPVFMLYQHDDLCYRLSCYSTA